MCGARERGVRKGRERWMERGRGGRGRGKVRQIWVIENEKERQTAAEKKKETEGETQKERVFIVGFLNYAVTCTHKCYI